VNLWGVADARRCQIGGGGALFAGHSVRFNKG
jgi:hypothetical protein